jgi:hypothetical protein
MPIRARIANGTKEMNVIAVATYATPCTKYVNIFISVHLDDQPRKILSQKANYSNNYFISILKANLAFIFIFNMKINLQILPKQWRLSSKAHVVTSQNNIIFVYHLVQVDSSRERRANDISSK